MDLHAYWNSVFAQDAAGMRACLSPRAVICWHNTNERFDTEGFIRANCEYPGAWRGELERVTYAQDGAAVCVARVFATDGALSLHVVSFLRMEQDRIVSIDEYWGDDGPAPAWRAAMGLSRPIRPSA